MKYRGYTAKIQLDEEKKVFHGEVLGTVDVITFQGTSVAELVQAFRGSVDDYLQFCEERGERPDKPYSGRFVLRTSPDLHRGAAAAADAAGVSLNAWVAGCIECNLQRPHEDWIASE